MNPTYQRYHFYLKDNDYNDWMPVLNSKAIDPEEELLLLTDMTNFADSMKEIEGLRFSVLTLALAGQD